MADMELGWHRIEWAVGQIIDYMQYPPDIVLGITRGGVIPAALVHRHFPKAELMFVKAKSYTSRRQQDLQLDRFDWQLLIGKHVLLIDDICDTGRTFEAIFQKIPLDCLLTITAIASKNRCQIPHMCAFAVTDPNTWVKFPWEKEGEE